MMVKHIKRMESRRFRPPQLINALFLELIPSAYRLPGHGVPQISEEMHFQSFGQPHIVHMTDQICMIEESPEAVQLRAM